MKKVVVIGGGTGQSALLRGLKQVEDIELYTIVTVADDGGSTGRLRSDLHLPAMGDVRSVMLALAEQENLMADMMDYRFDRNSGEMSGHNLGNIILSALTRKRGSFTRAIEDCAKVLRVKGEIIPSLIEYATLCAHMTDGSTVIGEHNITEAGKKIKDVFYAEKVTAYPPAIKAIEEADYIIIGIGSVYTSILPNLIIDEIKEALHTCKAKVIYYCNCMTEPGETDDMSVQDHVDAIHRQLGMEIIDAVVYANDSPPLDILEKYAASGSTSVDVMYQKTDYRLFSFPLISWESGYIRHDSGKVRDSFIKIMEVL